MEKRIIRRNILFILMIVTGLVGAIYEGYQLHRLKNINEYVRQGLIVKDDAFPFQTKFSAAYEHSNKKDYKHAIQSYSQLLETPLTETEQSRVQFNIGNNLMLSGLSRLTRDVEVTDEIKYDLSQAKLAYEQALRLSPQLMPAKFNLSLLLAILPDDINEHEKEQSSMELSNLPIGLP